MITDYMAIPHTDVVEFNKDCNRLIKAGWQPHGSMTVIRLTDVIDQQSGQTVAMLQYIQPFMRTSIQKKAQEAILEKKAAIQKEAAHASVKAKYNAPAATALTTL